MKSLTIKIMEKELNIAAILKDKPNARLYDELHNIKVELDKVSTINDVTIIRCKRELPNKVQHFEYSERGTERGWLDGLQILKPSQKMRDWSKFAWEKGDLLQISHIGFCTFEEWTSDDYTTFKGRYGVGLGKNNGHDYDVKEDLDTSMWYKVDNKDFSKEYLSTVEKRFGGKLNLETLEIEKPKQEFKDGDIVQIGDDAFVILKEIEPYKVSYHYYYKDGITNFNDSINIAGQSLKLASKADQLTILSHLKEYEKKQWDADKKAIVDLPKKYEFKPLDYILIKVKGFDSKWLLMQYSFTKDNNLYVIGGFVYSLNDLTILPYNDQTAHLLGTTDDWKGGE